MTGAASLEDLVAVSAAVTETSSRTSKTAALRDHLRRLALDDPAAIAVSVGLLGGSPRQRRTGVGYRGIGELPWPAAASTLTVADVDTALDGLAGATGNGSGARRQQILTTLLSRATAREQQFIVRVLLGELRQGALEAVLVGAVAAAGNVPLADVRRAVMLSGDVAATATLALTQGGSAVAAVGLSVGRAVQPMLASPGKTVAGALAAMGVAAVEPKLDGVRAQIHVRDHQVSVFTRTLDDVTARVPEVVARIRELPCAGAVIDAELIAFDEAGAPRPFQQTASRFATRDGSGPALTSVAFDLLHLDGTDLLDRPGRERWAALDALLPTDARVGRIVTADPARAQASFERALSAGHEGVIVKDVQAPYEAGRRGSSWVKVKPVHTLDLVVTAAEWGSGRRRRWLSNLHLAARSDDGSGFVMLGKTFKGLTDAMLGWQTEALLALADGPTNGRVVRVRPELVVEIALDGLQRSTRYPGGVSLRFARVVRHRADKPVADAATLAEVLAFSD